MKQERKRLKAQTLLKRSLLSKPAYDLPLWGKTAQSGVAMQLLDAGAPQAPTVGSFVINRITD